jgi:hypothetical protein
MCDNGNEGNMSQIILDNSQILLISFLRTLILFLARCSYNLITLFLPISSCLFITVFGSFRLPRAYYRDMQKSVAERIFELHYELAVATLPNHRSSNTTYL